MTYLRIAHFLLLATLLSLGGSACGKGKSSSRSQGSAGNNAGKGDNPSGRPRDGSAGSFDPHPPACTTCEVPEAITVPNCPEVLGSKQPCEGFCFVDESVTPKWNNAIPSSGPAYPTYASAWYEHQTPVKRGFWVHNLAHGYVVFLYNCPTGCTEDLDKLRMLIRERAGRPFIITEDKELTGSRFAAVSWGWLYQFDTVDKEAAKCYLDQHNRQTFPHH